MVIYPSREEATNINADKCLKAQNQGRAIIVSHWDELQELKKVGKRVYLMQAYLCPMFNFFFN